MTNKNQNKKVSLNVVVKQNDLPENTLRFIGSSEAQDRHGDIVKVGGWDLKNYKKNPVFLWGHDHHALPIGKAVKVFTEDDKLMFDIEFAVDDYDFARTVYKLYKGGFLKATSVGFMIKDWEFDEDTGAFVILKQELLELSAVTVPANPEALVVGIKKGVFTENESKELLISYKKMIEALEETELSSQAVVKEVNKPNKEDKDVEQTLTVKLELDTTEADANLDSIITKLKEIKELSGTLTETTVEPTEEEVRLAKEAEEKELAEKEAKEKELTEKELAEKEALEKEAKEKEAKEKELTEKELAEKEALEKEALEKEALEKEALEKEAKEKEAKEKEVKLDTIALSELGTDFLVELKDKLLG